VGAVLDGAVGTMIGAAISSWLGAVVFWWQLRTALRQPTTDPRAAAAGGAQLSRLSTEAEI